MRALRLPAVALMLALAQPTPTIGTAHAAAPRQAPKIEADGSDSPPTTDSMLASSRIQNRDTGSIENYRGFGVPNLSPGQRHRCTQRSAADIARTAAIVCGTLPVEDALRLATMPVAAARRAGEALAELGFATALDLQLLGGGDAAAEVLAQLKAGGFGPAARAKVRLLVGDREHVWRLSAAAAHDDQPTSDESPTNEADGLIADVQDDRDAAAQRQRRLQSSDAGSGISLDTIAIVLSVLVGAAGYVVQAHTARRAERAQEQQAMEQHTAEQARQREHQMMTAQIERTDQALHRCCRPVLTDIVAIGFSRCTIVQQMVGALEASHSDAVEAMLPFALGAYEMNADGTVTNRRYGNVKWTPNPPPELSRAMGDWSFVATSAAGAAIALHDAYVSVSKPFCSELPDAILAIIGLEPTGQVAEMYRRYVCDTLMPLLRRVTEKLREYATFVELPPMEWLEKKFPDISWKVIGTTFFIQWWFAYVASTDRVLSEWSSGNFSSCRPGAPLPYSGMVQTVLWAQQRAQTKQAELIGMTSVTDSVGDVFSRASKASVEADAGEAAT